MPFTEADRVKIRKYLGYAQIFIGADPSLENAIDSCQSIVDGGSRPDNSAELMILGVLAEIEAIETALKEHRESCLDNVQVGNIKTDALRAMAGLRAEGRRMIGYLANAVDTTPKSDVFSAPRNLGGDGESAGTPYQALAWRSG
jgi:hypothetical protein